MYLSLAVIGTALPCWQFLPFLRDHGLSLRLFIDQLFATPVSTFFGLDVIVSSVVLWVFVAVEGRRARVNHRWAPVAANLDGRCLARIAVVSLHAGESPGVGSSS